MNSFDFGISQKTALVCGSSSGIGLACAKALASCGTQVWINGRNEQKLLNTKDNLEKNGLSVNAICADVTCSTGRAHLLEHCPAPDILVTNAAGPPAGDFKKFDATDWESAVNASMLSPILLIKAVVDQMIEKKWGRIINITSSAVKAPLPMLDLSNGARSGLTGFIAGFARDVAKHGVTVNNILPGSVETDRLAAYIDALAKQNALSTHAMAAQMAAANPSQRFGKPEELGAFCAFLASTHAAYMTGQNILIDGGAYPGL
jgi:3-oxoacyl-[acyl-carrier protein] reductase